MKSIEKKPETVMKLLPEWEEKERMNQEVEVKHHRFGTRMSYEEIMYDRITEIPHYFDLDKFNDDSKLLETKSKILARKGNPKGARSLSRKKSIKEALRRKSIFQGEKDLDILPVNNTQPQDQISNSEIVFEKEKAIFKSGENTYTYSGTALVSDYRFRFIFEDEESYDTLQLSREYFTIPIFIISKLERSIDKKTNDRYFLEILTKDNRQIKFVILNEDMKLYKILQKSAFPTDDTKFLLFSFKFCGDYKKYQSIEADGWKIYDLYKELGRQSIDVKNDKSRYRVTRINQKFQIAPSYPKLLVVPRFMSDEELIEASNFRTKNRLPVLSFQYQQNKCCIWRSAQPKTGLTQQRSAADEKLLRMAIDYSDKLIVFDARPYLNGLAMRLKGGGFEIVENYHKCEIKFCEIDNIHAVSSAFQKLCAILSIPKIRENRKYYSELERSGWFEFLSLMIKTSCEIAHTIKSGSSVLIHCSDGWDRTAQLTSLAQILLDPYFRTLEGFIVLIEKDWLSFGHQFAYRNGNYTKDLGEEQRSQVFLQWLDSVHQVLVQFPQAFEFNLELINYIAAHFNTCLYGTFLFNNDREREEYDAKNRSISIWTDVLKKENVNNFLNPFYSAYPKDLTPGYGYYKLRLWEEFYFQYYPSEVGVRIVSGGTITTIKNKPKYLEFKKIHDKQEINNQKEKIENLNNIIKDLASIVCKNNLSSQLSENTKQYIEKLDLIQNVRDEQGDKIASDNLPLKIELLDNYVD